VNPVPTAPAPPTIGSNSPVCNGSTLNLTASTISGATYAWTGPSFTSSNQNPSISNISLAAAGSYCVQATVTATGCVTTSTCLNVIVRDSLRQVGLLTSSCDASGSFYTISLTLNGTPPYANAGLGGRFTGNVFVSNPIPAGSPYNVNFSDLGNCNILNINGISPLCSSKCAGFQIAVLGSNPTTPVLNNGRASARVLAGGFAPFSYLWSNGCFKCNIIKP
jgi:hypothetical protein